MKFVLLSIMSTLVIMIVLTITLLSSPNLIFSSLTFLLSIVILLFFVSALWPPDSPWSFEWRTDRKTAEAIVKLGKIGRGSIVYDLGCGDAEVLIASAKSGATGVGIEIDPFRYFVSRLRAKITKTDQSLKFIRGSFFDEDLSQANVVIVYLIPKTLNRLLPKFRKELRRGTKIISYRYQIDMKPTRVDKKNDLFLYII